MIFNRYLIDLVVSFADGDFLRLWFFPLIALAFIATVPYIFRSLFTWR